MMWIISCIISVFFGTIAFLCFYSLKPPRIVYPKYSPIDRARVSPINKKTESEFIEDLKKSNGINLDKTSFRPYILLGEKNKIIVVDPKYYQEYLCTGDRVVLEYEKIYYLGSVSKHTTGLRRLYDIDGLFLTARGQEEKLKFIGKIIWEDVLE